MFARAGARTRVRRRTRRPPVRPLRSPVPRRPRAARHCRPLDRSRSTRLRCPHSCALADPTDKRTASCSAASDSGSSRSARGATRGYTRSSSPSPRPWGPPIDLHHAADYRALTSAIEQGLVHFAWLPPLVGRARRQERRDHACRRRGPPRHDELLRRPRRPRVEQHPFHQRPEGPPRGVGRSRERVGLRRHSRGAPAARSQPR